MLLLYAGGNIWNFVYWILMPSHIREACDEELNCVRFYKIYGICVFFVSTLLSAYFGNVLKEYYEKVNVELDEIKINAILSRLNKAKEIISQNTRNNS